MITNFFITLLKIIVTTYSIVPNWVLPDSIVMPVQKICSYMLLFDGLVPVKIGLEMITYIIFFEIMYWMMRIVVGFFNFIRGSGRLEI